MGNAFEFFRNDHLNSKGHFEQFDVFGNHIDQQKAPFKQNQFGLTLGGPIKRDQTFYFLSAENLATDTSNFVTIDPAAAALLNKNGFPVELGDVPYEVRSKTYLTKIDHQWQAAHNLAFRANYASLINQNIEPFGGTRHLHQPTFGLRTIQLRPYPRENVFGDFLRQRVDELMSI